LSFEVYHSFILHYYVDLFTPTFVILLFFFNDTPTTELYTLSLHDALPISRRVLACNLRPVPRLRDGRHELVSRHRVIIEVHFRLDRKSTRLNSSHVAISYAVFCLKKKKILTEKRDY